MTKQTMYRVLCTERQGTYVKKNVLGELKTYSNNSTNSFDLAHSLIVDVHIFRTLGEAQEVSEAFPEPTKIVEKAVY